MPRSARIAAGGVIFHCLNRGNDRPELFADDADYAAFERVVESGLEAVPVRLLAYCVVPNDDGAACGAGSAARQRSAA